MALDYENPWLYKGTAFTSDDIDGQFGFVYRITNIQTGKQYIGRKYFVQKRKPKGGKRRVTSESDWKKRVIRNSSIQTGIEAERMEYYFDNEVRNTLDGKSTEGLLLFLREVCNMDKKPLWAKLS